MKKTLVIAGLVAGLGGCATTSEPTVVRSGTARASWYDEGCCVAAGGRYHPDGLTTAHRSLPFGTRVRVTNLRNARSVVVTVNDRGPAAWTGKDWDLSRGAARQIDMIGPGVVPVRWEVLKGSER